MPDYQRDVTLTGGSNDLFVSPGDYDYWLYNAPTNGSVTVSKAGKAPILISAGEVFVIHLQKGEELALSGTAGNTISILDHADVKLIPQAKDILGKFEIIGSDLTTVAAVKTTAVAAGDAKLVVALNGGLATGTIGTIQIANAQTLANVTNITNPVTVKLGTASNNILPNQVTTTAGVALALANLTPGDFFELRNLDATNNVAVGDSTVTFPTGYILKPGERFTIQSSKITKQIFAIDNSVNTIALSWIQMT